MEIVLDPAVVAEPHLTSSVPSRDEEVAAVPRLQLLGEFDFEYEGQSVDLSQSACRLLAFLAVHDHALTRSYVAGSLWPEVSQERAAGNFRSSLWRLRSVAGDVVNCTNLRVSLADSVLVDLHDLSRDIHDFLAHQEVSEIDHRLSSDLLPYWSDEWLIAVRERLRQLRLHAFDSLSERYIRLGLHGRAIDVALTAIEIDPLRESAHRMAIRAHAAEGNLGEALRQYDAFATMLARELRVRPSTTMHDLIVSIAGSACR